MSKRLTDPANCRHAWKNPSSHGTPVLGLSVCKDCAKTADSFDIRLFRAVNRIREVRERRESRGKL